MPVNKKIICRTVAKTTQTAVINQEILLGFSGGRRIVASVKKIIGDNAQYQLRKGSATAWDDETEYNVKRTHPIRNQRMLKPHEIKVIFFHCRASPCIIKGNLIHQKCQSQNLHSRKSSEYKARNRRNTWCIPRSRNAAGGAFS